ncbi:MAG TPA: hypothetical protein VK629_17965 [Steroidobacteraceae bacterium]|nr:hypothetical protein [Steroidobacteraceae bacterium]
MILRQLQSLLAKLYDVPSEHAVDDFLVTDCEALPKGIEASTDEHVFVMQADDAVCVTVYIARRVLERLAGNSPLCALGDDNLSDYCTALEGVSHFHYLAWRATRQRSVTLLELELQAEVDKYAAAMQLLTAQQEGRYPHALHERLFDRVQYRDDLDAESLTRYRNANRWAARFCRQLDERFLRRRRCRPDAWLGELRRFYRLNAREKLQWATA